MELSLRGKGALVTGGSRGIGKAIARALAAEGAKVAICARDGQALAQTAQEIAKATGNTVVPIAADITRKEDIQRFVAEAARHLGRLDILVNNAATGMPCRFLDFSEERLVELIRSKILGAVRCCREAIPYMRQQGSGCIINIAGQMGRQPGPMLAGLTSAALITFTRALSLEVAKDNIRVTVISPGLIRTERLSETRSAEEIDQLGRSVPLGHIGEPKDIAATVLYLASERATYLTGANIMVDGGQGRAAF